MRSSIKTKQQNKNGRKNERKYMKRVDMTEAKVAQLNRKIWISTENSVI